MVLLQLMTAAWIIFMSVYVVVPAVQSEGGVTVIEKQDRENRCEESHRV